MNWKKTGNGNEVLTADWGYISYNQNTANDEMCQFATIICNIFGGDVDDGEETALYDGQKWRILTGDFREQYKKAFPDFKKCLKVYNKYKKEFRNNYSTD